MAYLYGNRCNNTANQAMSEFASDYIYLYVYSLTLRTMSNYMYLLSVRVIYARISILV